MSKGHHKYIGLTKLAKKISLRGGIITDISHNHPDSTIPSPSDIKNIKMLPYNRSGKEINRTVYTPYTKKLIKYDKNGILYDFDKNGEIMYDNNFFLN